MRKKIIAGNWKMNIKPSETAALVKGVVEATKDFAGKVDIVCCTPAIDVPAAVAATISVPVCPQKVTAVYSARSYSVSSRKTSAVSSASTRAPQRISCSRSRKPHVTIM